MKRVKTTIICLLAVLITNSAVATVRYVPDDYPTIQAAINACNASDVVVVEPGVHSGPGNRNITLNGKSITVRSIDPTDPNVVNSTVIDCNGEGRGFVVYPISEDADSTVSGLTITNGYALLGGGIYCYNNSSPSIINCVITANSAVYGGAIACANSNTRPKISNCKIIANSASFGGAGGIYCNGASPEIRNCVITGNSSRYGGAVYSHNAGYPVIANCTISANAASDSAGAIYCYESSNLTISNSILWGNTAPYASEVLVGNSGGGTSIQISYCDIENPDENVVYEPGGTINWGPGNIDADPQFTQTGYLSSDKSFIAGDYHLHEESPCIDAGDPAFVTRPDETDIDGEPRISGAKIDMGADELVAAIPAEVKITPKTLNIPSNGKWISCSIMLLDDSYDIGDVNSGSITLNENENITPVSSKTNQQTHKLLVKFDRRDVQDMLSSEENPVLLRLSGKLYNGMDFAGDDTIRIIHTGSKK